MAGAAYWSNDTNIQGIALRLVNGNFTIVGGDALYAPNPKDTFYFAGIQCPGVCALQPGGVAQIEIDKKKAKGVDGARMTILGYEPGEFDIIAKIWTRAHWTAWQAMIDIVWARPTKRTQLAQAAAEIRHPILNALHVYQAALKGVYYAGPGPEPQSETFRFHFAESVLPVTAPAKTVKGAALGLTKNLPQLNAPSNATPPAPSTNPALFGPNGQPSSGGAH